MKDQIKQKEQQKGGKKPGNPAEYYTKMMSSDNDKEDVYVSENTSVNVSENANETESVSEFKSVNKDTYGTDNVTEDESVSEIEITNEYHDESGIVAISTYDNDIGSFDQEQILKGVLKAKKQKKKKRLFEQENTKMNVWIRNDLKKVLDSSCVERGDKYRIVNKALKMYFENEFKDYD